MRMYTLDDIREFEPCYDPGQYVGEDWQGSLLDILRMEEVPASDRIWFATQEGVLNDETSKVFCIWCGRQALTAGEAVGETPDVRSVLAVDMAEKFLKGEVSAELLAKARFDAIEASFNTMNRRSYKSYVYSAAASTASFDVGCSAAHAAYALGRSREHLYSTFVESREVISETQVERLLALLGENQESEGVETE
jgi:hypothetical protein